MSRDKVVRGGVGHHVHKQLDIMCILDFHFLENPLENNLLVIGGLILKY